MKTTSRDVGIRSIYKIKPRECEICKTKELIEVHHMDCNPLNNNIKNLMVLCFKHHKEIHGQVVGECKKRKYTKKCKKCKKKFHPFYRDQKYCSKICCYNRNHYIR